MRQEVVRNDEKKIQPYRLSVQTAFALLCIWIGIEFHLFVKYLESGGTLAFHERPPGVDGFLPISSLMNFYQFFSTGVIHPFHPAGFFIFLSIVGLSLVFGKSFCSWICPVGLISEYAGNTGEKIFKRKIRMPVWMDLPLRGMKYLLLGYLLYVIVWVMKTPGVWAFLDTPYNLMSDIKMYYFFAQLTQMGLIVIGALLILSVFFRNFWCRYLCPYGAFLGWTSLLSLNKINRNKSTCIDCGLCAKACPSFIKVDKVKTVYSDECTSCLQCVDACPVKDTLQIYAAKKNVNKKWTAVAVVLLFLAGTGLGMLTGQWQNQVSADDYLRNFEKIHEYGHPGR